MDAYESSSDVEEISPPLSPRAIQEQKQHQSELPKQKQAEQTAEFDDLPNVYAKSGLLKLPDDVIMQIMSFLGVGNEGSAKHRVACLRDLNHSLRAQVDNNLPAYITSFIQRPFTAEDKYALERLMTFVFLFPGSFPTPIIDKMLDSILLLGHKLQIMQWTRDALLSALVGAVASNVPDAAYFILGKTSSRLRLDPCLPSACPVSRLRIHIPAIIAGLNFVSEHSNEAISPLCAALLLCNPSMTLTLLPSIAPRALASACSTGSPSDWSWKQVLINPIFAALVSGAGRQIPQLLAHIGPGSFCVQIGDRMQSIHYNDQIRRIALWMIESVRDKPRVGTALAMILGIEQNNIALGVLHPKPGQPPFLLSDIIFALSGLLSTKPLAAFFQLLSTNRQLWGSHIPFFQSALQSTAHNPILEVKRSKTLVLFQQYFGTIMLKRMIQLGGIPLIISACQLGRAELLRQILLFGGNHMHIDHQHVALLAAQTPDAEHEHCMAILDYLQPLQQTLKFGQGNLQAVEMLMTVLSPQLDKMGPNYIKRGLKRLSLAGFAPFELDSLHADRQRIPLKQSISPQFRHHHFAENSDEFVGILRFSVGLSPSAFTVLPSAMASSSSTFVHNKK